MKRGGLILLVLMLFFVTSCSSDPYEKYLGLWERDNVKHYEVMEIVKDGETLLVNENILSSKNFFGNKKEPMVLKKSDGQLSVDTGLGSLVFGLSEDKSILRVGNISYKRIDNDRLNIIKADIKKKEEEREQARLEREKKKNEEKIAREKARLERKKDKKKCDLLISEINEKIRSIKKYSGNNKKWTEEYKKIKNKYTEKAKAYKNCSPRFY